MKRIIIITVLVIVGVFAFVQIAKTAIEKTEYQECITWQQQGEDYPNFYLLEWQKMQCNHYGIAIKLDK